MDFRKIACGELPAESFPIRRLPTRATQKGVRRKMAGSRSRANGSLGSSPRRLNGNASSRTRPRRLHRIQTVRRQQEVTLRTAARKLGTTLREARLQEDESTDLRLSDLLKWQKILGVPLLDLLVEPDTGLSRPVGERARLVRLMKTAMVLFETASSAPLRRLAQNLVGQLLELMPELRGVGPDEEGDHFSGHEGTRRFRSVETERVPGEKLWDKH